MPLSQTIAYLGPEGSFSHEFALKHFGENAALLPVNEGGFEGLIQKVAQGEVQNAIIPIFNSNGHYIENALKALGGFIGKVTLQGCYEHEIIHNLVVNEEFQSLKVIKTKPEVYLQCKTWLSAWGNVKHIDCASTSAALKEVRSTEGADRKWVGAICNRLAINHYGGIVQFSGIQNSRNFTLFAVIAAGVQDSGGNQVLICPTCSDEQGYRGTKRDFMAAGYEFKFGTLEGAFAPDVPLWIEFTRTSESRPLQDLLSPTRHFIGSYSLKESISWFIAGIFSDELPVDTENQRG